MVTVLGFVFAGLVLMAIGAAVQKGTGWPFK